MLEANSSVSGTNRTRVDVPGNGSLNQAGGLAEHSDLRLAFAAPPGITNEIEARVEWSAVFRGVRYHGASMAGIRASASPQSPKQRCPNWLPDDEFTTSRCQETLGCIEKLPLDDARCTLLSPPFQPILHAGVVLQNVEPSLALRNENAATFHQVQLRSG